LLNITTILAEILLVKQNLLQRHMWWGGAGGSGRSIFLPLAFLGM
jgi:hypothetical protein